MLFHLVTEENILGYRIKRITNTKSRDYLSALDIYLKYTAPAIRTNSNQMTYWTEQSKKDKERQMHILALFLNDEIIGFCQFAYFSMQKLIFIDYMTIDKKYRRFSAFFQFVDLVQEYIEQKIFEYDYIITEVAYLSANKEISNESKSLMRLLKMAGLGIINCNYYQPQLDNHNYESNMEAKLLLYSKNDLHEIKKETYLFIIRTIYFNHYVKWYEPFQNNKEQKDYYKHITQLYKKIENHTRQSVKIEFADSEMKELKGNPISIPKSPGIKLLLYFLGLIGLIIVFAIISSMIIMDSFFLILLFLLALFCLFALISIIDKNAYRVFKHITDVIKKAFDKLK